MMSSIKSSIKTHETKLQFAIAIMAVAAFASGLIAPAAVFGYAAKAWGWLKGVTQNDKNEPSIGAEVS